MFNNSINMSELTDEDIYKKLEQANRKLGAAASVGANPQIITQMQMIIESYHFELSDRMARSAFERDRKQLEAIIESDPSMVESTDDEKPEIKPRRRVSF